MATRYLHPSKTRMVGEKSEMVIAILYSLFPYHIERSLFRFTQKFFANSSSFPVNAIR